MFHALSVSHSVIASLRPIVMALRKRSPKLADQIERAATGITLNIAEAAERAGKDQLYLYRSAAASCREVRAALRVAIDWGYVDEAQIAAAEALLDRQSRLLYGLTRARG